MSNEKDWIDFNLVKQLVSMEMLIVHYGLFTIERKGDEIRLRCPFHNGKSNNSMAINLARNMFYCFGCKSGGNVIAFVSKYEDCPVKEAALRLDEWFQLEQQSEVVGREVRQPASNGSDKSEPITAQHLIASIEYQLAQLKKLILSR